MKRQEKETYLKNIILSLAQESSFFVLMHNKFKASQWIALRTVVKKNGGGVVVIKKRLAQLVFKELNYAHIIPTEYKGHIFIVTAGDNCFGILRNVRTMIDSAPKSLSILGGVLEKSSIKAQHLEVISKMKSEKDLYISVLRTLMHPLIQTARILSAKSQGSDAC